MGTRSLTFVTENEAMPILCMYRQMDGYPSGHGADLAEFLAPIKMVNGLGGDAESVANGTGCLAAQIVAHFKDGPGGIYLHRPNKNMDCWQEFEYWVDVIGEPGVIQVRVYSPNFGKTNLRFKGNVAQFALWCKEN